MANIETKTLGQKETSGNFGASPSQKSLAMDRTIK